MDKLSELASYVKLLYAREAVENRGRLVAVVLTQMHRQRVQGALILTRLVEFRHFPDEAHLLCDGEIATQQVAMTQAKVLIEPVHVDLIEVYVVLICVILKLARVEAR